MKIKFLAKNEGKSLARSEKLRKDYISWCCFEQKRVAIAVETSQKSSCPLLDPSTTLRMTIQAYTCHVEQGHAVSAVETSQKITLLIYLF